MRRNPHPENGFSLIELLIAMLLMTVIMGAIFQQINRAQQRSTAEQIKLDLFQESREFMDQMSQDLHQAGYPSPRNFASTALTPNPANPTSPYATNDQVAMGLTKIDSGDLWFEGDVDGSGNVSVVNYHLDTSTTNGCPCLRRSQQRKIVGDPLTGQSSPVYTVEVQNVQNGSSTSPIFFAYSHGSTGTALTLPLTFTANSSTIASIDTIVIVLSLQSSVPDPQTRLKPSTTLVSTVKLNNCSSAASGQFLSCQ